MHMQPFLQQEVVEEFNEFQEEKPHLLEIAEQMVKYDRELHRLLKINRKTENRII
jgi:hypothetical protein